MTETQLSLWLNQKNTDLVKFAEFCFFSIASFTCTTHLES